MADSLIRVNEAAVAMRWCRAIHRRVYKVAGPMLCGISMGTINSSGTKLLFYKASLV